MAYFSDTNSCIGCGQIALLGRHLCARCFGLPVMYPGDKFPKTPQGVPFKEMCCKCFEFEAEFVGHIGTGSLCDGCNSFAKISDIPNFRLFRNPKLNNVLCNCTEFGDCTNPANTPNGMCLECFEIIFFEKNFEPAFVIHQN